MKMNCSQELLERYIDDELEAGIQAEVKEHLAGCRGCAETYAGIRDQSRSIRLQPYYDAPPDLHRSIRDALRQAAPESPRPPVTRLPWRSLAIAASLLLAVSLVWNVRHLNLRTPENDVLAESILSSHVRSLIGTHLLDVVSTDQHTVKPWFNGRVDFSPVVRDFAPQGFPLIGGRIDYLSGRTVAALVYRRRQHIINLFTWPSSNTQESDLSRNGFNELQWTNASMTYWVVSDLGISELRQFKQLCTQTAP